MLASPSENTDFKKLTILYQNLQSQLYEDVRKSLNCNKLKVQILYLKYLEQMELGSISEIHFKEETKISKMDEKNGYIFLNRYFEEVSEFTAEKEKKFFK